MLHRVFFFPPFFLVTLERENTGNTEIYLTAILKKQQQYSVDFIDNSVKMDASLLWEDTLKSADLATQDTQGTR